MNQQDPSEKLSTVSYWDDVLKSAQLPRINDARSYLYGVTMKFVDRFLGSAGYKTFFEVGCGSSGWLPYFSRKYNYKVSGLDYSEIGCKLATTNLELLGIDYGEILCRDFYSADPTNGRSYDVVFSYGVIEHFSDPEKVVGIFKTFVKDSGLMITLIPNFAGVIGKLTKIFIPEVYKIHNVITREQLESYHRQNQLQIATVSYAGVFAFNVMPWIRSTHWLFKENTFRRKAFLFLINGMDKVLTSIFKIMPFDIPSRTFSPYIICIAKKI